jgi:molybdopterin synthase catalytic subunit
MVSLTHGPIDIAGLQNTLPRDGALCVFAGVVRNENEDKPVLHLKYEAYEEMAIPLLEEIEDEARKRWPLTDVRIVHRLGRLEIGQIAVVVAVTAAHRRETFEACQYLIDTLKATAPIWKKEFYEDGSAWLDATARSHVKAH